MSYLFSDRVQGADFTMPFMSLGLLSIINLLEATSFLRTIRFSHRNFRFVPKTIEAAAINVFVHVAFLNGRLDVAGRCIFHGFHLSLCAWADFTCRMGQSVSVH